MDNLQKSMKYSMIFGIVGAVLMPVVYELYANVSQTFALLLWTSGTVYCGIKFSSHSFKDAFLGITCTMAYSGVLGSICYMIIHPKIKDFLMRRSVYFQLGLKEQAMFFMWIFLIMLLMYVIWAVRFAIVKTASRLKTNSEKAGEYIDNAFSDNNQNGENDK